MRTHFDVSIFDELVENGSEDEADDAGVVVGQVDGPGLGTTNSDQHPVDCGLWQFLLPSFQHRSVVLTHGWSEWLMILKQSYRLQYIIVFLVLVKLIAVNSHNRRIKKKN